MFKFELFYNVILILHVCLISAKVSEKKLCANKECSEPISEAKTILGYGAINPNFLSFPGGLKIQLYSEFDSYYGAKINKKHGYVPKSHVKVIKMHVPTERLLKLDLEESSSLNVDSESTKDIAKPSPDPVQPLVIDGTTLYLNNDTTTSTSLSDNSNHKETEPLTLVNVNDNLDKSGDTFLSTNNQRDEFKLEVPVMNESPLPEKEDENHNVDKAEDDDVEIQIDEEENKEDAEILSDTENPHHVVPLVADGSNYKIKENSIQSDIESPPVKNSDHKTHLESTSVEQEGSNVSSNPTSTDHIYISTSSETLEDSAETSPLQTLNQNIDNSAFPNLKDNKNSDVQPRKGVTKAPTETEGVPIKETQIVTETSTLNDKIGNFIDTLSEFNKSKKTQQLDKKEEVQNQAVLEDVIPDIPKKQSEAFLNRYTTSESHNNKNQSPNNSENLNNAIADAVMDTSQTSSPKEDLSNLEVEDNTAASDFEIADSSVVKHHHNIAEGGSFIFQPSQKFLPAEKSVESRNIANDVLDNDNNENSIASEHLNPTEEHDKISDFNGFQNMNLTSESDLGSNNNIIEESISNERDGISSDTPLQTKNSQDVEENGKVSDSDSVIERALKENKVEDYTNSKHIHDISGLLSIPHIEDEGSCSASFRDSDCPSDGSFLQPPIETTHENVVDFHYFKLPLFAYEVFLVLIISAVTIVVFLWGYIYIDRRRKEIPLVAKINNLQKQFLILRKENELLTEKVSEMENDNTAKAAIVSNEIVEDLKFQLGEAENIRLSLEQQIQNLEKELDNSTEVGLELNRMLSEFLNSDNGSDNLIANIDQLQRQLIEQQGTINTYNETLSIKETENHELRLELEINNSRVNELQSELNKMAFSLLKLEEDKEQLQNNYDTDVASLKEQLEVKTTKFKSEIAKVTEDLSVMKQKNEASQRNFELKTNEYKLLKENINQVNSDNNNSDILKSMFDNTSIKAELLQLRNESQLLNERLQQESSRTSAFEKQAYLAMEDAQQLKVKYDTADQERMEAQTKLEILSNYFKEREAQLQKELSKQESMWIEKQGEATSTIERIKYMQEELQNYKAQYESLKQEIVAQEVEMKSQISVLEKKAHENWVAARQAERKLEDAKQEAAQLRNRLTLRERNFNDDKAQNRLVSPLEQNGDLSLNDNGPSLPLMFGTRDHLTSPPLPSLSHFLPPPPGVPFIPPPLGGVPLPPPGFLPPPPSMIPGDHRPPPLGRMSSPPLNSRYSPDSMVYSSYSRNSPSPTSDDDYDRPAYRSYSPYNRDDRREFSRPPPPPANRNSVRNHRGTHSSGSAHSNESVEKMNRHNSKV